jgi:selenide,water dikinase
VLPGAWDLLDRGVAPGGTHRNLHSVADTVQWSADLAEREQLLLCDAQTSGGLLISVAGDRQDDLVSELKANGVEVVAVVGSVTEKSSGRIQALV